MDEKPIFWLFPKEVFMVAALAWILILASLFLALLDERRAANTTVASIETRLNLNEASADKLTLLPGIGKRRAGQIVEYREDKQGFESLEDLRDIKNIPEPVINRIRDFVTVD